jgi:hypothetical protein
VHAEASYEWREKGVVLPIAVAVLGLPICLLSAVQAIRTDTGLDPLVAISGSVWLVLICFFLGAAGPRGEVRDFKATRPMTDTQLADSILVNVARSVLTAWALWSVMLLLVGVLPLATGTPLRLTIRDLLPLLLLWCGLVLASGGLSANAAVLMLLSKRLATTIVVGTCVLPIWVSLSLRLLAPADVAEPAPASLALAWSLLLGLLGTAAAVVLTSRRLRLISPGRLAAAVSLQVMTCAAILAVILWQGDDADLNALRVCVVLVAATYTWLPLAAAPLAMWSSRHR